MSTINVLIVVDALGAATSGDLQSNVYLIDTNKHVGSGAEGTAELYTACHDSNIVAWAVSPVNPGNDVSIDSFTGEMVDKKICTPTKQGLSDAYFWAGRIQAQGQTGNVQYSVRLNIDGKIMSFDPFLKIS